MRSGERTVTCILDTSPSAKGMPRMQNRNFTRHRSGLVLSGYAAEIEAVAGLARCALEQHQFAEAGEFATRVWEHFTEHYTRGMEQPALA